MGKRHAASKFASELRCRPGRAGLIALASGLGCLLAVPAFPAGAADPHRLAGPAARPELPYREILDHLVVVPVTLDGHGPYNLVLDTGAIFTTLDADLAEELGLRPLGRIPVVTIAGSRPAARGRLDRVELGPVAVSGVDVVWTEMDYLPSGEHRVRGVLGQSALSRISFGLDHRRERVLFEPPDRADAVLPLVHREGRPAVTLSSPRVPGELSLVLDTGAAAPVLFQKPGKRLPVRERRGRRVQAHAVSGRAALAVVELEGRVGGVRIHATLAGVQDDGAAGGREEDGLLPSRLFRSVYFDRERRQLLLQRR